MSSLKEKVVVITGASAGIGAASAVKFAKHGCRLVLHGRNERSLNEVADRCVAEGIPRGNLVLVLGDLKSDSTVENIIARTLNTFGTINILYNNAGYATLEDGPVSIKGNVEILDDMYRINVRVPYMLIKGFASHLIETKGVIINCSSSYSTLPDPSRLCYCITKAALDHFTKILAIELGMKGVRINSINPGFVKTNIARPLGDGADSFWQAGAMMTPLEQEIASAEDIANIVVFLASNESSAISGANLLCDRAITLTSSLVDFTQYK